MPVPPSAPSLSPTCPSSRSLCLHDCFLPPDPRDPCLPPPSSSYPVGCLLPPFQELLLQGLTEATRSPKPLHNGLAPPELLLRHKVLHAPQVGGQRLLQRGHREFGQPLEGKDHRLWFLFSCVAHACPQIDPLCLFRSAPSLFPILGLICFQGSAQQNCELRKLLLAFSHTPS